MRYILLISLFLLHLGTAVGEDVSSAIRNYNKAQQGGTRSEILDAARAMGEAALQDPSREDTALIIFEAAQKLAMNGAETDAIDFAIWLESANLPPESPVANEDVSLLVSYIRWSNDKNKDTRKSLDESLDHVAPLEPTLLTVFAFQKRYLFDLNDGSTRILGDSALAAANHLEDIKHLAGESWSSAVIVAHSAAFNWSPNEDEMFRMAEHRVALREIHSAMHASSDEHPSWIDEHRVLAETWQLAMHSYFDSQFRESKRKRLRRAERLDAILDGGNETQNAEIQENEPGLSDGSTEQKDSDSLKLCDGSFDMKPPMRYPRRAIRQGRVGAVMVSVDMKDGRVSNAEILAAIPPNGFADETIETIKKWTWVVDEETAEQPCSLDAQDMRWPFTFVIN